MTENQPPIIVRRIRKSHQAHGGAWKVAFADFATAMMAFFLVLWLGETTDEEQKQAIAGYFTDPIGYETGGSPHVIDFGGSVTVKVVGDAGAIPENQPDIVMEDNTIVDIAGHIEQRKLTELMKEIVDKINNSEKLAEFNDQLIIDITEEGLRIQIVDKSQRPMFASGDDELQPYFEDILYELAPTISLVPNKVSISGHTDSAPFFGREQYSNWELSSDRANAARRALVEGGLPDGQVSRVVGLASSVLFDATNPLNPVNRRISIIVLNSKTQQEIEGAEEAQSLVSESELEAELNTLAGRDADLDFKGLARSVGPASGKSAEQTNTTENGQESADTIVIDSNDLLDTNSLDW